MSARRSSTGSSTPRSGRQWSWFDRLWWTDAELAAYLGRPEVSIRVLHLNGAPAGYYELVAQPGQLGGNRLLRVDVARDRAGAGALAAGRGDRDAWSTRPKRVWLHTCTLDHPTALPNYLKAGFVVTGTAQVGRADSAGIGQ